MSSSEINGKDEGSITDDEQEDANVVLGKGTKDQTFLDKGKIFIKDFPLQRVGLQK